MWKDKSGKVLSRSEAEAIMKGRAAVTVTIMAAILAIISIIANGNSSKVLNSTIQANNLYAFYQAKSIKQGLYDFGVDQMTIQLLDNSSTTAEQDAIMKKMKHYQAVVDRYENDPQSGEGKIQLLAKARQLESERNEARAKGPWFSFSQALMQIAIVFSSSAILAVSMTLLYASVGTGMVALGFFANAMWIHYPWPF
jgi:hypothetical protein